VNGGCKHSRQVAEQQFLFYYLLLNFIPILVRMQRSWSWSWSENIGLVSNTGSDATEMISFDDWRSTQMSEQPQFAFSSLVLEFELAVLAFVRSIRAANFQQYINSLQNLVPWFFVMNRTHYARWVPVHIRDMVELQHNNPGVFQEFSRGRFTVNKTNRSFSAIAIDHAHEQMNATVKGDGGAIYWSNRK